MRVVITETQGFSAVETQVLSLAFWHHSVAGTRASSFASWPM